MKTKTVIILLLVAVVITALAGCTPVPELPADLPQISLPADLPQPSKDRVELIETEWKNSVRNTHLGSQKFYQGGTKDGIRYYGSYEIPNPDYSEVHGGDPTVYNLLYIPYPELAVPSEITLYGHTFRSRTAFCLFVFSSRDLGYMVMSVFHPFNDYVDHAMSNQYINDGFLSKALQLHNTYEELIYGSALDELPEWNATTDEMKMQELEAAWFMRNGTTSDFQHYGRFDDCDILFVRGELTVMSGIEIAGETFSYHSSFGLLAYKDGEFRSLKKAYEEGLVSRESIAAIAQVHRSRNGR